MLTLTDPRPSMFNLDHIQTWTSTATVDGRLTDSSGRALPDALYSLTVTLYDAPFSDCPLYTEELMVRLEGGRFSVLFGAASPFRLDLDEPLFLGLQVGANEAAPFRVELRANTTDRRIWSVMAPVTPHALAA